MAWASLCQALKRIITRIMSAISSKDASSKDTDLSESLSGIEEDDYSHFVGVALRQYGVAVTQVIQMCA